MTILVANAEPRVASLRAVVTRADGSVEDLGLIAFHHRNPIIRRVVNAWIALRRSFYYGRSRSK